MLTNSMKYDALEEWLLSVDLRSKLTESIAKKFGYTTLYKCKNTALRVIKRNKLDLEVINPTLGEWWIVPTK